MDLFPGLTGNASDPWVRVRGCNIYLGWLDDSSGNKDVYFSRSVDCGVTFSSPMNVSNTLGSSERLHFNIDASGTYVYLVWKDNTLGNFETYFIRSTDGGLMFEPFQNLSNNAGDTYFIEIAVSGSNVYIQWPDTTFSPADVLFVRSLDNGASFSSPINLTNTSNLSIPSGDIKAQGLNVYTTWEDTDNITGDTISFLRRSTDQGANFDSPVQISIGNQSNASKLLVNGQNVFVLWSEDVTGQLDIYLRRSTDGGVSFSDPPVNISNNAGNSDMGYPALAMRDQNVYVTWFDDTPGNVETFFSQSSDGGVSFGPPANISSSSANMVIDYETPRMALGDTHLFLLWQEAIGLSGEGDVFVSATPIPLLDTDGDGLPDGWEEQYGLDPNDSTGDDGASGDPDLDGYTNLQEYLGGSNPLDSNSTPCLLPCSQNFQFTATSTEGGGDPMASTDYQIPLSGIGGSGTGSSLSPSYQLDSGFSSQAAEE